MRTLRDLSAHPLAAVDALLTASEYANVIAPLQPCWINYLDGLLADAIDAMWILSVWRTSRDPGNFHGKKLVKFRSTGLKSKEVQTSA